MASNNAGRVQPFWNVDLQVIWDGRRTHTYLTLSLPVLEIIETAFSAYVDVLSWPYKHIICGHNIGNGWLAWIFSSDPDRDGNIIGRVAERYGKQAVDAEE